MNAYTHVIVDRDGVLNREPDEGWIVNPTDFVWERGSLDALTMLSTAGIAVSVVTNQSCIGRGVASSESVAAVHARMLTDAGAAGVRFAGVYVCPHADEHACICRKPAPGMILDAVSETGIDAHRTLLIGDAPRDLIAGLAGGVDVALVRTGKGRETERQLLGAALVDPRSLTALEPAAVPVFDCLLDVVRGLVVRGVCSAD